MARMLDERLARIADELGLGGGSDGEQRAEPVRGGSIPIWRLHTPAGSFHVKVWPAYDWEWGVASRLACAELEWAAVAAGVPTAEPVALATRIGVDLVSVHRWVEGVAPAGREPGLAHWVGETLPRLHTLPPPSAAPADAMDAMYGVHDEGEWRSWFEEAATQAQPWAAAAASSMPLIEEMGAIVRDGRAAGGPVVGSHRDLDAHNLLWDGVSFTLIDWDMGGPDHAWLEAVRAAIVFGRVIGGGSARPLAPDLAVVESILGTYVDAGGARGVGGWPALAGTMGLQLGRLAYFSWVSLGHRPCTAEERDTATAYVNGWFAKSAARMEALTPVAAWL